VIESDATVELFDGAASWGKWEMTSPLRVATHAKWDGTSVALSQGQVAADRLAYDRVAAQSIEASFAFGGGTLHVDSATLRACGGSWRSPAQGRLDHPTQVDASLTGDEIDSGQIADALPVFGVRSPLPIFDQPLHLDATASGSPGRGWTGHAELATAGGGTWSKMRFEGPLQLATGVTISRTGKRQPPAV